MAASDHYFRSVAQGKARGVVPSALRALASLAEPIYAGVVSARNAAYSRSPSKSVGLPRPTLSVGNLSVGGTGKTPMVATLTRSLLELGHRPAILTRGYRAAPGHKGDEQLELEGLLGPSVPVIANPDRVAGAATALAQHPGTTLFILDDGFQHRRVRRDVDIVLISATQGLSGNHVLPRGLLREPPRSLGRADALIITRADQVEPSALAALRAELGRFAPAVPVMTSRHLPSRCADFGGREVSLAVLRNQRFLAAAGTGDPGAFIATLRRLGADVAAQRVYPDHHAYAAADVDQLLRAARDASAEMVITTSKDAVKLRPLVPASARATFLVLEVNLLLDANDAPQLLSLIERKIKRPHGGG
jgi:tetraacyldisaccharide 4'-kinase